MRGRMCPQLAWIADQHGMIFWYNDRWYEYTGTTLDQMYGWGWTGVHHPDHVERVKARIQEAWDTGVEWEDTFPLRGRDGSYRWFLSRAKPLFDNNGKVWRWFGINTDITIQRENEEKIRLLMGEVNHRAKNMIAIVQAVVSRTANKQFAETLAQRLQALSRNQDLLTKGNWKGTAIGELITSQPYEWWMQISGTGLSDRDFRAECLAIMTAAAVSPSGEGSARSACLPACPRHEIRAFAGHSRPSRWAI